MWNCSDMEVGNILAFLKNFEEESYDENMVQNESEVMFYNYGKDPIAMLKSNNFYISKDEEKNVLEKYTFSNALSQSVKLGIWENSLDRYVDSMEPVTEDLKQGNKFKITRAEMLRKTGELFALRHHINLSSDLLDTPDFYWDREQLETLYAQTTNYFSISKRTRVINERLNHLVELCDLITSNLNDIHHVRLEKIIIYLIMIEVGFECLHYAERYYG
jgi:required for meiotic nuclear division protein 1